MHVCCTYDRNCKILKAIYVHVVLLHVCTFSPVNYREYNPNNLEDHYLLLTFVLDWSSQIALPNLKKLRVEWNDTMEVIRHGQFQAEFFSKLQVLELTCFPNDYSAFPSHFLQRFPNLESLLVSNASFEEIVLHEETDGEEKHARVLEQLRELELSKLPKLMHLSREDSQPCPVFQNLITLKVLECSGLKILVPFSVSFECLMTLEVSKCHRLINLMTSSTAKCLMQLTRLSITECEMIEHIIGKEENDAENEVIFHNLECLRLHCLPSLTSFYFGNCGLMFPSLEKVFVRECAKMEIFSEGITSTPKLKRVLLTEEEKQEEEDKGCWEGNLNATIQKLFMEMVRIMSLNLLISIRFCFPLFLQYSSPINISN